MCCNTFVRYVIKIKRTLLSSYIKNCKKSRMNKPSTIKNTIFSFFLSSLFISFSNIGCRIYKNNTPPIPNLILGDNAILPCVHLLQSTSLCATGTAYSLCQLVDNAVKVTNAST